MVGKLIRLGFLRALDHANIPNLKNLRADLRNVTYDPGRKYSLTWQSGLAGIAVNPATTGGKRGDLDGPAAHRPGRCAAR